ncbi:MAG TPA: AI-2E family transporter [Vicinamibacteria bacterium]|nr:AI-2E family transporter [Vicinamibacteria bacterium]
MAKAAGTPPAAQPLINPRRASFWTTLVLTVLAVILMASIIRPFATALFIGAVLAGALFPVQRRLTARMNGRRQLAAALVTVVVFLTVVLPLASLAVVLAREVSDGVGYVRRTLQSEGMNGLIMDLPAPLQALARKVIDALPSNMDDVQQLAGEGGRRAASAVGGMLAATWEAIVHMIMMLIALFFFLVDGPRLVDWLADVLPLREGQTRKLLDDFRKVTVAVLVSSVATAGLQTLVAFVGYLIARVPNPVFFSLVTFLVGLVPAVGASAVVLFAALTVFLSGHTGYAIFLALWGAIAVGLTDNIAKPFLMRTDVKLHGAVVFFALLGGLAAFGPVGLLAGPLIVSFFLAVMGMWERELDRAEAPART